MLIHVHLVLIPLFLALSAIFAAAEAALFSLSASQLETIKESKPGTYRRIRNLVDRPDAMLSTFIIGNECLNIMIGTFIVTLLEFQFAGIDDRLMAASSILLSSFLLLTFSEVLPKVLGFRMPVMLASFLVYPMTWAQFILTPLRKVFETVSSKAITLFRIKFDQPQVMSEKDFLTLVEVGAESGSLDRDEKEMIINVFNFSDLPVSAVMTPWAKVFHITEDMSLDQVLSEVRKKTYSRIPVLSKPSTQGERRVAGILYTKELLKVLLSSAPVPDEARGLGNAVFPPYIVSTHKKISKLFREFKQKKVHMALVVDEYGRHLGIITLEDVLNSLFRTQKKAEVAGA